MKDFYRLDNYVLRLRPEAARKLLDILQSKLNATMHYREKYYGWDTILRLKCQELAGCYEERYVWVRSLEEPAA
jgi:hypothetical protein